MADSSDYRSALRLGRRDFRQCTAEGRYPYLPVLDDFISSECMAKRQDLGLIQIPITHIVGTRAKSRTIAFAENYMPLLPEDSEFALKWQRLCDAHLDEGIRDPIKVYEYLNRYYVEEGNKRVSVLKFFGATSLFAQVHRVLPERLDDHPLYKEYLDFYAVSKVNYVDCTKLGGYESLQRLVGKEPGTSWSDEDRERFASSYHRFQRAFEATGGKRLETTVGDAMLSYMTVFGYPSIRASDATTLRKAVAKVWEDIELQQESELLDVKLEPDEKEDGLLSKMVPKTPKHLDVAFIHDKNPELSGWTWSHEQGRAYVQQVFEGKVDTKAYFDALDVDPLTIFARAIDEGNTVIFTTSPRLLPASLKVAVNHPELIILNCSLGTTHRYIRTYYARMYEAKFVAGVIAGALSGDSDVGYVCDYPIAGQVAGVNAFAVGVQTTNPFSKVRLEWSSVGAVKPAEERLTDQGVWIVSSQDIARLANRDRAPFGLSILTEAGSVLLASPTWNWGVYYETLLRQIQDKTIQTDYVESSRALNYYWGMSADVVTMRYSDELPAATKKMARLLERSIRAGLCEPFRGPLIDQQGRQMAEDGESLSPEKIIRMGWLNENIIGEIPSPEDLTDIGKLTVGVAGVMMG